jgi:hypothetical protein
MAKSRFKIAVWSALFLIGVTAALPSCTKKVQVTRFDSTWALEVYESRGPLWKKLLGHTPTTGGTGVLIPAGADWYVKPIKNLTDEDLYALVAELKQHSIPGLSLLRCDQITDAGLANLKELKGLTRLDLSSTNITDAGLAHLKELKGLTTLNLGGTQINGDGLAHLKELKGLTTLGLDDTRITDAGLAHLKELKGLTKLGLVGTQITDAGLANLKELKGLTELRLGFTQISDAGLKELRSALPKCKISR